MLTHMNFSSSIFRYRAMMLLFIGGLIVSGVTAFPLLHELKILAKIFASESVQSAEGSSGVAYWILTVRFGLEDTYAQYPWIAYGTDWLAFAHIVIAMFFFGPLINPIGSRATLYAGICACLAVIPLALICGPIRGIPFYWRLIDCSFGIIGILPLLYCLRMLKRIESETVK